MNAHRTKIAVIIGAGPAGLSASIYASRYKLNHLLLGAEIGGQVNEIRNIENWPGDISVAGFDLLSRFVEHAKSLGINPQNESVVSVKKNAENILRLEKLIFNFLTNPLFYLLLSNKKFSNSVNRAYLIIEKDKK